MEIRLSLDTTGMMAKLNALAAAASDPTVALLRCGGVVRSFAKSVFEAQGPNWPALDPVTQARKITAAEVAFLSKNHHGGSGVSSVLKLAKQIQRGRLAIDNARSSKSRANAQSKQDARTQQAEALSLVFASKRLSTFGALVKFAEREKARSKRHGQALVDAKLKYLDAERNWFPDQAKNKAQLEADRKKAAAIGKRRYMAQGNADRVLGNLDKSLSMYVKGAKAYVFSHAKIGGVHNIGGTAGHGAKIPARPFMYVPAGMEKIFAQIFREVITGAIVE